MSIKWAAIKMKLTKNNMINKDYSPDTAHLPNKEDIQRWRNGGRKEYLRAKEAQQRFLDKWNKNRNK